MKNKSLIMAVVAVLIVGAAAFFGGMKYQQSKQSSSRFAQFGNGQGRGQFPGAGGQNQGFRPVRGEVISVDDKSLTVKLADSSSKIVLFSDKTDISKSDPASKADIKSGQQVLVLGSDNPDGSVAATSIQLDPKSNFGGQASHSAVQR